MHGEAQKNFLEKKNTEMESRGPATTRREKSGSVGSPKKTEKTDAWGPFRRVVQPRKCSKQQTQENFKVGIWEVKVKELQGHAKKKDSTEERGLFGEGQIFEAPQKQKWAGHSSVTRGGSKKQLQIVEEEKIKMARKVNKPWLHGDCSGKKRLK